MLSKIDNVDRKEEQHIFENLIHNMDSHINTIFNSGAGSGKTYALVEGIRYIINSKYRELQKLGQQVVCITYTNVAANEVKKRLGDSSLVLVSTIHERLWSFIKDYPYELDEIHKLKLESEIESAEEKLNHLERIMKKPEELRIELLALLREHKKEYYHFRALNAVAFREGMKELAGELVDDDLLKNVTDFKNWVKYEWLIESYSACISRINEGSACHAEYDALHNSDHLDKMRFSHDTLLEYGLAMIYKYPRLSQLVSDSYPYFFVDEYQDTAETVIRIIARLIVNAHNLNHPFWCGFFGDPVQSIYEKGIGDRLETVLSEYGISFENIDKPFNRRSTENIIAVGNKIRGDSHLQKSIYSDSDGDAPVFYYLSGTENKDKETIAFVEKIKEDLKISPENRLHCFVLTNKYMAEAIGIDNIWNYFSELHHYGFATGNNLSTELLATDLSKLGHVQRHIYDIVSFLKAVSSESTFLADVFSDDLLCNMTLNDVGILISIVRNFIKSTLNESISAMDTYLNSHADGKIEGKVALELKGFSDHPYTIRETILNEFIDEFYKEESDEINPEEEINKFLDITMDEFFRWIDHVQRKETTDVIYHTYHGTKGLEYDNVLIIMDAQFNKKKDYFPSFFKEFYAGNVVMTKAQRNLLYVATTRAKKHLIFLYRDPVVGIEEPLEKIWGSIKAYTSSF